MRRESTETRAGRTTVLRGMFRGLGIEHADDFFDGPVVVREASTASM